MMATAHMIPKRFPELRVTLLAAAIAVPTWGYALPDDDAQQLRSGDFASLELSLDTDEFVQKAHPDRPTCITQGSRVICGAEIRFERGEDGNVKKVTATGSPASFDVQPEANQEVAHFRGQVLVFDNEAHLLTIDGDAEFVRGSDMMSHEHIEYHLDTRSLIATGGGTDEQGSMSITPATAGNE
jgi:lipopolysaccharide export system protein LptA